MHADTPARAGSRRFAFVLGAADVGEDIEDSIMRVDEMLKLKAAGRFDEALKLAVLKKEAEDISEARKLAGKAEVVLPSGRQRQFTGQL